MYECGLWAVSLLEGVNDAAADKVGDFGGEPRAELRARRVKETHVYSNNDDTRRRSDGSRLVRH